MHQLILWSLLSNNNKDMLLHGQARQSDTQNIGHRCKSQKNIYLLWGGIKTEIQSRHVNQRRSIYIIWTKWAQMYNYITWTVHINVMFIKCKLILLLCFSPVETFFFFLLLFLERDTPKALLDTPPWFCMSHIFLVFLRHILFCTSPFWINEDQ